MRALYIEFISIQDMGVYHGTSNILMTEQFLYGANIITILEQVGGK